MKTITSRMKNFQIISIFLIIFFYTDFSLRGQDCKFLGSAYSASQSTGFLDYFDQVTPENAGKWGSVEYSRDVMTWSGLDEAYNLAKNNGLLFKLHVLIWGNQQPAWIEPLDSAEQRQEIEEWFDTLAARYPDMDIIEVVNEPINDPPDGTGDGNYIKALGGRGATGWDWVLEAFRLARQYFPNAKLMINEYNLLNNTLNTNKLVSIVNLLKEENLIDAVGFQAHAFTTFGTSASTMQSNLDKLAATGLPLYATELDIDGPTDQDQLTEYQRVLPVIYNHPSVKGVTLWGYRPGLWRNTQKAYIVLTDGTERPAMTWLKNYVQDCSFSSVDETLSPDYIRVYPNPVTNGSFMISGIEKFTSLRMINVMGVAVLEMNISNQPSAEINPDHLNNGMYIIQLNNGRETEYRSIIINNR